MNNYISSNNTLKYDSIRRKIITYSYESQQGKSLLQKRFGNLKTIHIIAVCVRLYPAKDITNFRRNPAFKIAFYIYYDMLENLLEAKKAVLEICQHKNLLTIILAEPDTNIQLHTIELINKLYDLFKSINTALSECEEPLLQIAISADCGYTHFSTSDNTKKNLWLGDVLERAEILCNNANNDHYPNLLISHAIYQQLTKIEQEYFTKAYYINHIACYGCSAQNITTPS